ncbi:DUF5722 domain-containing protein [Lacunimicrobium album]
MRFAFVLYVLLSQCLSAAIAQQPNTDPYPTPLNKKGLQVQMIDDAIALGVQHAALNVDLSQLTSSVLQKDAPRWTLNGKEYAFNPAVVADLDARVKPLSDRNILVNLILLPYATKAPVTQQILLHPRYAANEKNTGPIAMFNTTTPQAADTLQACTEFLAHRYSSDQGHGRVWGYICGNEVNSHWFWANMGRANPEEVVTEYEKAVRLIHQSVRKSSTHARVYLSLEHCWNQRYAGGDELQCIPGRQFLDQFAATVNKHGNFDWHLAYHPYPEPLTDPRFWNDEKHSLPHADSPCITFRNLAVLTNYLQKEDLQWEGQPRRVILSEQGFHCDESRPDGEPEQAAAYALAYKIVEALPGIDAFILHRHTDHAQEGGLNLGLWTNQPGQLCTPDRKRKMYDVFQAAGTSREAEEFQFALPIIGAASWEDALSKQKAN